jgi:hypothetical protein
MSRPVGVTASAIVALLGSIIAALFAALMAASPFMAMLQPQPPGSARLAFVAAAVFSVLAVLGIWSSVGLFGLRPWARTSILVFASFLAIGSLFSLLMTPFLPRSPNYSAGTEHVVRLMMVAGFGIPLVIAVWWLIQFNTQSTKAAFASPAAEPASSRPLSITVIAWACIVGGATCLVPLLLRSPAFLFGTIFNGWSAALIYVIIGTLQLYIGKGLLDLQERARILAIAWTALSFVHGSFVILVPSMRQRVLEMPPTQANPIPMEGMVLYAAFAFSAILAGTIIWLLIRNRAAFGRAGNSWSVRTT